MARDTGEARSLSDWEGRLRTVCHDCRGSGHVTTPDDNGMMGTRPVVVPGEGEIVHAVATAGGYDSLVSMPCPTCGDTEQPGWLDGFIVPV